MFSYFFNILKFDSLSGTDGVIVTSHTCTPQNTKIKILSGTGQDYTMHL